MLFFPNFSGTFDIKSELCFGPQNLNRLTVFNLIDQLFTKNSTKCAQKKRKSQNFIDV